MSDKTTNRISFGDAPTAKRGTRRAVAREVPIKGIRDLKACRRVRAVIFGMESEIETAAKQQMSRLFITTGCDTKRQPDNFTGVEENQPANCQLRTRSFGAYGVDPDVAAQIAAIGMPELIEESETFIFNPEVLADPEIRGRIETALNKVKGLPANLVLKDVKLSLKAGAIDTLFATRGHDPAFVEAALPLLSQLAIRCDYDKDDTDVTADVARIAKLMNDPKFAVTIQQAAGDPDKILNPPRKPAKKKAA